MKYYIILYYIILYYIILYYIILYYIILYYIILYYLNVKILKPPVPGSKPESLPEMWRFYYKLKFFYGLVGQSTSVHSANSVLRLSTFSKSYWKCAGITLQNWCQLASRVTDVCSESVIDGNASEISKQRAIYVCVYVHVCVCVCVCVCSGKHFSQFQITFHRT